MSKAFAGNPEVQSEPQASLRLFYSFLLHILGADADHAKLRYCDPKLCWECYMVDLGVRKI